MKCSRMVLACVCITLLTGTVSAAESASGWKGDFSLGFTNTAGNSDTTSLSISFTADRTIDGPWTWKNKGSYLNNDTEGETTADSSTLDTRLEWQRSDSWFAYGQAGYMRDRFKDYDYRLTPGMGFGWQLIQDDKRTLRVTAGMSAVMLKYRDSGETDSYAAVDLGNTFNWKMTPSTQLTQALVLNMDVSDTDRYFLKFELGLSVAINDRWGVKLSFVDNYDNQPVSPDVKKNDTQFIGSIQYRFGH